MAVAVMSAPSPGVASHQPFGKEFSCNPAAMADVLLRQLVVLEEVQACQLRQGNYSGARKVRVTMRALKAHAADLRSTAPDELERAAATAAQASAFLRDIAPFITNPMTRPDQAHEAALAEWYAEDRKLRLGISIPAAPPPLPPPYKPEPFVSPSPSPPRDVERREVSPAEVPPEKETRRDSPARRSSAWEAENEAAGTGPSSPLKPVSSELKPAADSKPAVSPLLMVSGSAVEDMVLSWMQEESAFEESVTSVSVEAAAAAALAIGACCGEFERLAMRRIATCESKEKGFRKFRPPPVDIHAPVIDDKKPSTRTWARPRSMILGDLVERVLPAAVVLTLAVVASVVAEHDPIEPETVPEPKIRAKTLVMENITMEHSFTSECNDNCNDDPPTPPAQFSDGEGEGEKKKGRCCVIS
eukprot:Hpha_TRINITY_DN11730_c0_g1::TRINITY_DN11730_c0_g1_i1::g.31894::m.31894